MVAIKAEESWLKLMEVNVARISGVRGPLVNIRGGFV